MLTTSPPSLRFFLTYSGISLPLRLTEELTPDTLRNRNTYFQAAYDAAGRMLWLEKLVYGEVEMRHDYEWDADGRLRKAIIRSEDEEPQVREFGLDAATS
ncbi:MAG: hypothetical protein FD135_5121 [Comamonadaceae bacterium]|nr:MAG: hypothetical protein FD135_5121 [Comamonadaceae bacterium]